MQREKAQLMENTQPVLATPSPMSPARGTKIFGLAACSAERLGLSAARPSPRISIPSPSWGRGWLAAFVTRGSRANRPHNLRSIVFEAPEILAGGDTDAWSIAAGFCLTCRPALTPSPVPPPLVKTRVAVHPLPQGGEGRDSQSCVLRMYKLQACAGDAGIRVPTRGIPASPRLFGGANATGKRPLTRPRPSATLSPRRGLSSSCAGDAGVRVPTRGTPTSPQLFGGASATGRSACATSLFLSPIGPGYGRGCAGGEELFPTGRKLMKKFSFLSVRKPVSMHISLDNSLVV
jgi:hypothetical protein